MLTERTRCVWLRFVLRRSNLVGDCGKEISEEEGNFPPTSSSTVLGLVSFSDAINLRLEQVIIPRCFRFRSSCMCRVYADYYFHVVECWLFAC